MKNGWRTQNEVARTMRVLSWMRGAIFGTLTCLLFGALPTEQSSAADQALNVILILADDLGWTDLGCYGSDLHQTPRLDQLAQQGMRFTQNYSACTVCSPTRAALMTGKYPARLHITDWIPGAMPDNPKLLVPDWTKYLPLNEFTLAEHFKSMGYATATIGKWHLGEEAFYPEKQGFDLNIAGTDKPQPPSFIAPWNIPTLSEGEPGEYLTDRLGKEAAAFIERKKDMPFFLYLPHFAVHTPIQGPKDLVSKYQAISRKDLRHRNPQYAAMVESLDRAVGMVLDKLEQLKLSERTIVIFTSDNGGRITANTTDNSPLRYGKASAYEGGVRVPLIVKWPGTTRAGSSSNVPTITMDIFKTLVENCSSQSLGRSEESGLDGIDLAPLLRGDGVPKSRQLYWHYPHHQHYQLGGTMPYSAVRDGDYKLIEFFNDGKLELYNLREDIGEKVDLSASMPGRVETLHRMLVDWRKTVGAQMPIPNPNHDASRPEYNPPTKKK